MKNRGSFIDRSGKGEGFVRAGASRGSDGAILPKGLEFRPLGVVHKLEVDCPGCDYQTVAISFREAVFLKSGRTGYRGACDFCGLEVRYLAGSAKKGAVAEDAEDDGGWGEFIE